MGCGNTQEQTQDGREKVGQRNVNLKKGQKTLVYFKSDQQQTYNFQVVENTDKQLLEIATTSVQEQSDKFEIKDDLNDSGIQQKVALQPRQSRISIQLSKADGIMELLKSHNSRNSILSNSQKQNPSSLKHSKSKFFVEDQAEITVEEEEQQQQQQNVRKKMSIDNIVFENVEIISNGQNKSKDESKFIEGILRNHLFFKNLTDSAMQEVVLNFFHCKTKKGEFVYHSDDLPNCFYIVKKGKLNMTSVKEQIQYQLDPGQCFGEYDLIHNMKRKFDVFANEDCEFWALKGNDFRRGIQAIMDETMSKERLINAPQFFQNLTNNQQQMILFAMIPQKYKPNDLIILEGDVADTFFIISKGQVQVEEKGRFLRNLKEGDSFGEMALFEENCQRGATVIAIDEVQCITIGQKVISEILDQPLETIIYVNKLRWVLYNHHILKQFKKIDLEKILMKTEFQTFGPGDIIFKQKEEIDYIAILLTNPADLDIKSNECRISDSVMGNYELTATGQDFTYSFDSDIRSKENSVVGYLKYGEFYSILQSNNYEQALDRSSKSKSIYNPPQVHKVLKEKLKLEDFTILKRVGRDCYQVNYIVMLQNNAKDKNLYNLQIMKKNNLIEWNITGRIREEKKIFESLCHPFITNFIQSFQDESNIYFVTDFVYGHYFKTSTEDKDLKMKNIKFYVANILLILQYLHERDIVYRDVATRSFLIDQNGYLMVQNMNNAKYLAFSNHRARTLIGEPNYLAPQMHLGLGYSYEVDFWSLGVLMFKLIQKQYPFGEECDDPFTIYESILSTDIDFTQFEDHRAGLFLCTLLNKEPERRNQGSIEALKSHFWFQDFDWDSLYLRTMPPPVQPEHQTMDVYTSQYNPISRSEIEQDLVNWDSYTDYNRLNQENLDPQWDKDF